MRSRILPALTVAVVIGSAGMAEEPRLGETAAEYIAGRDNAALAAWKPGGPTASKARFGAYEVRTYRHEHRGAFEIRRNGKRVYAREGCWFTIVPPGNRGKNRLVAMGRDLDGNGVPNLLVDEFSGGAHCCFWVYLFELGGKFRKMGEINLKDAGFRPGETAGPGGKKRFFLITGDMTFAYWRHPFSDTCSPEVKLEFRNGAFRPVRDLMPRPVPSATGMEAKAAEVLASDHWAGVPNQEPGPPSILYGYMLELIYAGNAARAWDFLAMAWKPRFPGREEYLADFRKRLATSPWYEDIKALNPGTL